MKSFALINPAKLFTFYITYIAVAMLYMYYIFPSLRYLAPIFVLVGVFLQLGWPYAAHTYVYRKDKHLKKSIRALDALILIAVLLSFASGLFIAELYSERSKFLETMLVPVAVVSVFSIVTIAFIIYFASAFSLVKYENNGRLPILQYIWTVLLVLFLPLGIFLLHPRLKRL